MDNARRKELVREYKERKQVFGIYAVRCAAVGKVWVAASRNLDRQQNSTLFQLRGNGHPNKTMQAAWKMHGESAFVFEALEEVTDDNPLLIEGLLKDRAAHWLKTLNAKPVIG
jgi:hypothetical protein